MIVILDFGSQYTQLIARRVREAKVYCEIHPYNTPWTTIHKLAPKGLILSGGPQSVYVKDAPHPDAAIYTSGLPVLGICYGLQLLVQHFGGEVKRINLREYGPAKLKLFTNGALFEGLSPEINVWMSHGDAVVALPKKFRIFARTSNAPYAAIADLPSKIYGVQFHPEVHHTPEGAKIIRNFACNVCNEKPEWTMRSYIDQATHEIKNTVGEEQVIMALSGGVDSSVAAILLEKAIPKQVNCIFVDNGLLRQGEKDRVKRIFGPSLGGRLRIIKADNFFLSALARVTDPERKRKIIGRKFIEVFERESGKIGDKGKFLAQGTLYPDVIESISVKGPSATIKTHHNVGGLPKRMHLKLVEPLRFLFKDEVRELGKELGLPGEILHRHPFPGPGLAVRVVGEVTSVRLEMLRLADAIVEEEILKSGLYERLWQAFAVFLPVKSVGVMGDERTYENVIAVRAVDSVDAMTADWSRLPYDVLAKISNRIINEVRGINRVVYDISSKPPSTIEWE